MILQRVVLATVLGGALIAPVFAEDRNPQAAMEALLDPRVLLGGLITENDASLVFAQLRAAMLAATEGREPPPMPEALQQRLESVGSELRLRGLLTGLLLSRAMEQVARDAVRELTPPPPPPPGTI